MSESENVRILQDRKFDQKWILTFSDSDMFMFLDFIFEFTYSIGRYEGATELVASSSPAGVERIIS